MLIKQIIFHNNINLLYRLVEKRKLTHSSYNNNNNIIIINDK